MQEPGNRHFFRASVLQNCRSYGEKMSDIGDGRFLAHLATVHMSCV